MKYKVGDYIQYTETGNIYRIAAISEDERYYYYEWANPGEGFEGWHPVAGTTGENVKKLSKLERVLK